jgi:hypothetical protein
MGFSAIHGPSGELVFGMAAGVEDERRPEETIIDNWAFMERACNAYDDLVAALDNAEAVMSIVMPRNSTAEYLAALAQIRAALAKARA